MGVNNPKYNRKVLTALPPLDYGNCSGLDAACVYIDTKGFKFAEFTVVAGAITGTSLNGIVQDCATSGGSYADVTGASITALASATDDVIRSVVVDCSKTARYLKLDFTASSMTVTNICAICSLSGPSDSPYVGTGGVDANVNANV